MASFWIDSELGSGDNDGSSPANAVRGVAAIRTGFQIDHVAGTIVYVRRTSIYDEAIAAQGADIVIIADGTFTQPVVFMGWPRAAIPDTTITEGDWTNGSVTVDNIVGITGARRAHCSRWATAPDGKKYIITRVIDTNTFIIDREYAGSTVTGTDGKFQIESDEDYADRDAAGTSAGWDSDAHDLPEIDFNNENYNINNTSDEAINYRNLSLRDSSDSAGILYIFSSSKAQVKGCLFYQSSNTEALSLNTATEFTFSRSIIQGIGSGTSNRGISGGDSTFTIKDSAIYGCGDNGVANTNNFIFLDNVNIGVEIANGDNDMTLSEDSKVDGIDVKFGGTNGYFSTQPLSFNLGFENWGKVLGKHKSFMVNGSFERVAVTDTNANKKLSDYVLQVDPYENDITPTEEKRIPIFDGSFELEAGSQTIKFWLYNDLGVTINDTTAKDNVYLQASYVDSYDDITEYTKNEIFSTEIDILDAADADDWDSLSVVVNPVTASKVRVKLFAPVYSAANVFLIDPEPVIT